MDEEIENPYWSVRALVQQYEGQRKSPSESSCSRYCGLPFFTFIVLAESCILGGVQASSTKTKSKKAPIRLSATSL